MNAEAVVRRIFRRWQEKFHSLTGETFQQRADDVADLGRKVLRHLEGKDADGLKNLPAGSVLVLQHLLPSDVVSLSRHAVAAIVVESLGQGSHAALLAREKSLPGDRWKHLQLCETRGQVGSSPGASGQGVSL